MSSTDSGAGSDAKPWSPLRERNDDGEKAMAGRPSFDPNSLDLPFLARPEGSNELKVVYARDPEDVGNDAAAKRVISALPQDVTEHVLDSNGDPRRYVKGRRVLLKPKDGKAKGTMRRSEGVGVATVVDADGFYAAGRFTDGPERVRSDVEEEMEITTPGGVKVKGMVVDAAYMTERTYERWAQQYRRVIANRTKAKREIEARAAANADFAGDPPAPAADGDAGFLIVEGYTADRALVVGLAVDSNGRPIEVPGGASGVLDTEDVRIITRAGDGFDRESVIFGRGYAADKAEVDEWKPNNEFYFGEGERVTPSLKERITSWWSSVKHDLVVRFRSEDYLDKYLEAYEPLVQPRQQSDLQDRPVGLIEPDLEQFDRARPKDADRGEDIIPWPEDSEQEQEQEQPQEPEQQQQEQVPSAPAVEPDQTDDIDTVAPVTPDASPRSGSKRMTASARRSFIWRLIPGGHSKRSDEPAQPETPSAQPEVTDEPSHDTQSSPAPDAPVAKTPSAEEVMADMRDRVEAKRPGLVKNLLGRDRLVVSDQRALELLVQRVEADSPIDISTFNQVLKAQDAYGAKRKAAEERGLGSRFPEAKSHYENAGLSDHEMNMLDGAVDRYLDAKTGTRGGGTSLDL